MCLCVFALLSGQRVCVRLVKNSRDLGFSLEGGVGSSLGNRPLSIQKIFQGENRSSVCQISIEKALCHLFIPKVFDRVEVSAFCRPFKVFHTKFRKLLLYIYEPGFLQRDFNAETGKGLYQTAGRTL